MAKRRTRATGPHRRRTAAASAQSDGALVLRYVESSALVAALLEHDEGARAAIRGSGRRVSSSLTLAEATRAVIRAKAAGRLSVAAERAAVRALQTFARRRASGDSRTAGRTPTPGHHRHARRAGPRQRDSARIRGRVERVGGAPGGAHVPPTTRGILAGDPVRPASQFRTYGRRPSRVRRPHSGILRGEHVHLVLDRLRGWCPNRRSHSARNATIGSTFVALRAGT